MTWATPILSLINPQNADPQEVTITTPQLLLPPFHTDIALSGGPFLALQLGKTKAFEIVEHTGSSPVGPPRHENMSSWLSGGEVRRYFASFCTLHVD